MSLGAMNKKLSHCWADLFSSQIKFQFQFYYTVEYNSNFLKA
jgi:hypothetical protein